MPHVGRYNAKDTTVLVKDVYITALGEEMITYEKKEPLFEPTVGAQGDVVRSEINDSMWELTVTVLATSPQMPMLLALKNEKEVFPVWAINKALGITLGGAQACIEELPEVTLGKTVGEIPVKFCIFDGDIVTE